MSKTAIETAISIANSQSELARRIGTRQGTLWKWIRKNRVPAEYCVAIERATEGQVTRYQLRPDVFGSTPDTHQDRIARSMESPCTPTVST